MSSVDKLVAMVEQTIDEVDEHLSRTDFALVVSQILREGYGTHNYEGFMSELQGFLDGDDWEDTEGSTELE